MPSHPLPASETAKRAPAIIFRLRKHADYQRVYKASRKQFSKQMSTSSACARSLALTVRLFATPATPLRGSALPLAR